MDDESTLQTPKLSAWQRWAEIAVIVLAFLALAGDPPPHVNEPHYLCRAKHFWNPDWCRGDLFLDSTDAHLVFVVTFGWVTKWLTLVQTAWLGRLLAWTLLAWAWQRLSWQVVRVPWCSCLSAVLFVTFTERAHLAGEWVVGGVEAKCFAYVFVLLALTELARDRWNRVWILLGCASAFHALVGGWTVVACGGVWLVCGRKTSPLSMLPGLVTGGLLALFGVLPALALSWNQPAEVVQEANRIYVFERLPHHLAPLSRPAEVVVPRIAWHGALLLALFAAWQFTKADEQDARPRKSIDTEGLRRLVWFAWCAALLAAMGFALELVFWNQPPLAAKLLRYYWFRLTDVAAPLALALLLVAAVARGIVRHSDWAVGALTVLLIVAGWQIGDATYQRITKPVPPSDRAMGDYDAWVETCQWVAENTPPDALFLTPRLAQSFKWRTGRPEVVTRKDIPQDAANIVEWWRRYRDVFLVEEEGELVPVQSLGHLGTQRVEELANEYQADYILTDRRAPLALPVAFANDYYVVYVAPKGEPTNVDYPAESRGL